MSRKPIITVTLDDNTLKRYANQFALLGERDGHRALARAVNRTTTTVRGRVAGAISKQSSIPLADIRSGTKTEQVRPGSGGALEGRIIATGKPLSLKAFKPRQNAYGTRAKVWGKLQTFKSAFIFAGTPKSGMPVAGGHVFVRTSAKSLPIERMFGPSIPEEMVRGESKRVFEETTRTMLPQRVAHEIARLLRK